MSTAWVKEIKSEKQKEREQAEAKAKAAAENQLHFDASIDGYWVALVAEVKVRVDEFNDGLADGGKVAMESQADEFSLTYGGNALLRAHLNRRERRVEVTLANILRDTWERRVRERTASLPRWLDHATIPNLVRDLLVGFFREALA